MWGGCEGAAAGKRVLAGLQKSPQSRQEVESLARPHCRTVAEVVSAGLLSYICP